MACRLFGAKPLSKAMLLNWTLRNKLQRNFNQNTSFFIQENAYENFVCEIAHRYFVEGEMSSRSDTCSFISRLGLHEWQRLGYIPGYHDNSHSNGCRSTCSIWWAFYICHWRCDGVSIYWENCVQLFDIYAIWWCNAMSFIGLVFYVVNNVCTDNTYINAQWTPPY